MNKSILIFLIGLSLLVTIALSPIAEFAQLSAQPPVSPISPIPVPPKSDSDKKKDAVSSDFVWLPQSNSNEMWIKTQQVGVGWWDADGNLYIELNVNGIVVIPLQNAVMISIPGDAAGIPVPPGWKKIQRPENGEWVIVRATS